MRKRSASFMLTGEDARLIESIKVALKPKMGTLTNVQIIRMALRLFERSECREGGDAHAAQDQ